MCKYRAGREIEPRDFAGKQIVHPRMPRFIFKAPGLAVDPLTKLRVFVNVDLSQAPTSAAHHRSVSGQCNVPWQL